MWYYFTHWLHSASLLAIVDVLILRRGFKFFQGSGVLGFLFACCLNVCRRYPAGCQVEERDVRKCVYVVEEIAEPVKRWLERHKIERMNGPKKKRDFFLHTPLLLILGGISAGKFPAL